ncbi:MAG: COX15/CtaA family protein [Bdellovibrionota bacterium]|nr:MAG: COX15/CtaA family protein [Bdellovibrionota bacterium]
MSASVASALGFRQEEKGVGCAEQRALGFYAKCVVAAVLLLILKGALVTSNMAGLAVPDWPTTFGENMFLFSPAKWKGIIFYEHVHRLLASIIGLLTVILSIWISLVEKRRSVRIMGWIAVVMVVFQGVLGGLTVLHLLPPLLSASHGVVAQTFLLLTIAIAYSYAKETPYAPSQSGVFRMGLVLFVLAYLQLIIGALMRHHGAGLAVPDFPLMGGSLWPAPGILPEINRMRQELGLVPVDMAAVSLHLVHRVLGFVLLGFVVLIAVRTRGTLIPASLRRAVTVLGIVTTLQVALGVATILSARGPIITSLHVVTGALFLAASFWLVLRTYPRGGLRTYSKAG